MLAIDGGGNLVLGRTGKIVQNEESEVGDRCAQRRKKCVGWVFTGLDFGAERSCQRKSCYSRVGGAMGAKRKVEGALRCWKVKKRGYFKDPGVVWCGVGVVKI